MQAAEGKMGRVFMLRLDDGDLLPASIEHFAKEKNIKNGFVLLVGGIGSGQVVVGPRDFRANAAGCHAPADRRRARSGGSWRSRSGCRRQNHDAHACGHGPFRKNDHRLYPSRGQDMARGGSDCLRNYRYRCQADFR